MLGRALVAATHRDVFLSIVRRVVAQPQPGNQPELRDRWLVAGYLGSPDEFFPNLRTRLAVERKVAWLLRDLTGSDHGRSPSYPLTITQSETIVALIGALFPEAYYPAGVINGNTNAWDAAAFVRSLINGISALPSTAAGEALERLNANPALASYRDTIHHALAGQHTRRRDAEYHRPNWDEAAAGLANGAPANVGDLCALTVAQLEDIAIHIGSANTDIYKQFWNVDRYGRLMETRPEETCRDALLTLLKPRMLPLGVTAEPEGHMADDKRADIALARPGIKVLVELKKNVHADVWNAVQSQLDRFYTPDPEAKGFGVYGVFWFGNKRNGHMPAVPGGLPEPRTPSEMENTLRELLPDSVRARIAVIVIDVSGPAAKAPSLSLSNSARARGRKPEADTGEPKGNIGRTKARSRTSRPTKRG